jgi:putative two-component system response regulator
VRSLSRVKHLIDALDSAEAAFITLALTIEARDPSTNGHCERLAQHAVRLGRTLSLGHEDLEALHRGGYLHDVGKIGIPDSILLKPGPLTPAELALMRRHPEIGDSLCAPLQSLRRLALMRRHPEIGDSLCAPLQSLRRVRPIVIAHHERLDGSGYPGGLRGDEIPLLAQIVGIVDVFDALTSERPYRVALSPEESGRYLVREAEAGKFAPRYVEAFLDTLSGTRLGLAS